MRLLRGSTRGASSQPERYFSGVSMLGVLLLISSFLQMCSAGSVVPRQSGSMKVMIVGDSISCGADGDYTWRYFIWKWFRDNGVGATFVGPRTGTQSVPKVEPPRPPLIAGETDTRAPAGFNGGYNPSCDPAFTSSVKHLAQWGLQVNQAKGFIRQEVANHMPDMLLIELGFNDLGWFVSGAQATLQNMKTFVDEARRANPNVKMVIANVPQRTYLGFGTLPQWTAEYNNLLVDEVPKWSTAQSPIYVANFAGEYSCNTRSCAAGYDGLHPNTLGDYQIARAFSIALNRGFKLGNGPLTVPGNTGEAAPATPGGLRQVAWDGGIRVEWNPVPGARLYEVEECWPGGACSVSVATSSGTFLSWVFEGMQKEYRVRAVKSQLQDIRSGWSGKVTATAHPKTAPAPKNIKVFPAGNSFRVTWDAPDGGYNIDRYQLIAWDSGNPGSLFQGMSVGGGARSLTFPTDFPSHNYFVAMASWIPGSDGLMGGFPAIARWVIPNGGTPGAAQNPRIITYNNGASIRMRADGNAQAAGYSYAIRRVDQNGNVVDNNGNPASPDGQPAGTSRGPCWTTHFLFPGAWNYEFRMAANNGDQDGPWSSWIRAPVQSTEGEAECPPDPSFTPGASAAAPDTPSSKEPTYDGSGSTTNPSNPSSTSGGTSPTTSSGGTNPPVSKSVAEQRGACGALTAASIWSQSGASAQLDSIVQRLTSSNSLNANTPLDRWVESYVSGMSPNLAQSNCGVPSGNCPFPTMRCEDYENPVYWIIQTSFANLNDGVDAFNQRFGRAAITEGFSIDEILDNFEQIPNESPKNSASVGDGFGRLIGSIAGLVGSGLGVIPGAGVAAAGAGLSVVSGASSLVFEDPPSDFEIRGQNAEPIRRYIGDTLAQFTDRIYEFLVNAFVDGPLGQPPKSSGEATQIARLLAGGAWLQPLPLDSNAVENMRRFIRHGIVGAIMKDSLVVVRIGVRSNQMCSSVPGGVIYNNQCWTLEYVDIEPNSSGLPYRPLPADVFTQMNNIGLNPLDIMLNTKQCIDKYPSFDDRQAKWIPENGAEYRGYPECFFSLVGAGNQL